MRPSRTQPGFLHRVIAGMCLGLVVWLGLAGQHAGLHAAMHTTTPDHHHDEGCAVDLFASGVEQPVEPHLVRLPDTVDSLVARTAEPAMPARPAGLHPPGQGPPLK